VTRRPAGCGDPYLLAGVDQRQSPCREFAEPSGSGTDSATDPELRRARSRPSPGSIPEYDELRARFHATLTEEQRGMDNRLSDLHGDYWMSEQDYFVDEMCWHFPGLAPAIRSIAWHVIEELPE
jgi:hypothetical protein